MTECHLSRVQFVLSLLVHTVLLDFAMTEHLPFFTSQSTSICVPARADQLRLGAGTSGPDSITENHLDSIRTWLCSPARGYSQFLHSAAELPSRASAPSPSERLRIWNDTHVLHMESWCKICSFASFAGLKSQEELLKCLYDQLEGFNNVCCLTGTEHTSRCLLHLKSLLFVQLRL